MTLHTSTASTHSKASIFTLDPDADTIVETLRDICRTYGYNVVQTEGVTLAIAWSDDAVSFRELVTTIASCTSWTLLPSTGHHPLGRIEVSYLSRAYPKHIHLHVCPGIRR